jgi:hypothetical protein
MDWWPVVVAAAAAEARRSPRPDWRVAPCQPPHLAAGPALNFVLLSWLYALYCFDYKWSLHGVQLQQRIAYFERHWAFFLGG